MTRFDELNEDNLSRSINKKELQRFKAKIPKIRKKVIHQTNWDLKSLDAEEKFGVDGNTIRAFRGFIKPIETYRTWARSCTKKLTPKKLSHITASEENFEKWHSRLVNSITNDAEWSPKEKDKKELKFAHLYKLVDLYIKWLTRYDFGSKEINDGFIKYAHCALDKYTMERLKLCFSGKLSFIKKNPSMGDVCCLTYYYAVQKAIKILCSHAGKKASPILFDYYAWNYAE